MPEQRHDKKNILVVGGGGREHALAWKLAQSPLAGRVYIAPGNAGTGRVGENVDIAADDFSALADFAEANQIALTVVGPEAPLAAGIGDFFISRNLPLLGPTQAAARLESSKVFAKRFMARHGIPTPAARAFDDDPAAAKAFVGEGKPPFVIKADGLAAGKGVLIAEDKKSAAAAIDDVQTRFGGAGRRFIVEEFIGGRELSFIALCDGKRAMPLASAQDYKRLRDGDAGPNTGGMGAVSPSPLASAALAEDIVSRVINPALRGMAEDENAPFRGFLYAGLVFRGDEFFALEFNCRLGDPEAQVILPRMKSDLLPPLIAAANGDLGGERLEWDSRPAVGVVLAAPGYPESAKVGEEIATPDSGLVFLAGAKSDGEKKMMKTSGGRVLCAVALGDSQTAAREGAYQLAAGVHFPNAHYRRDIGAVVSGA